MGCVFVAEAAGNVKRVDLDVCLISEKHAVLPALTISCPLMISCPLTISRPG